MNDKKPIATQGAPKAIGPYAQAIRSGSTVYCSGQIALDPASGELVEGGIRKQVERVLDNLEAVLAEGGLSLADVVRSTIYLVDLADFPVVNELYGARLSEPFPARATVGVAALPKGGLVEIDMIAVDSRSTAE
jgi:2-iminobutanoate/2-iminopropanoate deaminase